MEPVEGESSAHARQENVRMTAPTKGQVKADVQIIGQDISFKKNPEYIKPRIEYFDKLMEVQNKLLDCKSKVFHRSLSFPAREDLCHSP